ncbi:MAG: response regulator transcription factor [Sphaerochaetaceae bacterium]
MKLLVVEDERQLSTTLAKILQQQMYAVDVAHDGTCGEDMALSGIYDVILLDIMLPGKSGLEVLKSIRAKGISTPVLLLTAKYEVEDKINGLDLGADDYLTKPFASGELLARIRAMSRRKGDYVGNELTCKKTILHRGTHELICKGNMIKLGHKEFQIMEFLIQNKGQIIPKERFIEKIWGYDYDAEYNAIETYISFLRKKLIAINADIQIKTSRGIGYSLEDIES